MATTSSLERELYQLCRPRNAINPALAVMLGVAFAHAPSLINQLTVSVAVVSTVLLNFAYTLQNDLADNQLDSKAGRKTALTTGVLSLGQVRLAMRTMMALALGLPLLLGMKSHVIFVLLYSLVAWQYNKPPVQASKRPISSITLLALLLSVLPFGFGVFLAQGSFDWQAVVAMTGWFLYRWSTSILKDYKDFAGDSRSDKRTFLVAYGGATTRTVSIVTALFGSVLLLAIIQLGNWRIVDWAAGFGLTLVLIYGWYLRWRLSSAVNDYERNNTIFHTILDVQLVFELGVLLWLALL